MKIYLLLLLFIYYTSYFINAEYGISNFIVVMKYPLEEEQVKNLLTKGNTKINGTIKFFYEDNIGIINDIFLNIDNVSALFLLIHLTPKFERVLISLINEKSFIISYTNNLHNNFPKVWLSFIFFKIYSIIISHNSHICNNNQF